MPNFRRPDTHAITVGAVSAVALVAAVVSYVHTKEVAARAGEGWRAWLEPLAVDGLVISASMTMVSRKRGGEPAGWLPWASLVLGLLASLCANVAAAEPTWTGRIVAAWPPVALLLAYEMLMSQTRGRREVEPEPAAEQEPAVEPVPEPEPVPEVEPDRPARRRGALQLADAEVRRTAVETYLSARAGGVELSGRELADPLGRSERWGRDRIAEAKQQLGSEPVTVGNC